MCLDPAVHSVPFGANIDIRDTVNYKEVMSSYDLGPNGGIMTSLNLFATKFDQVLALVEARKATTEFFLVDTPGQIEIFTWSASGAIITEALASELPTVVVFVVDTPRSTNPVTFMSNMLYATSVLYKTQLPMVVVLNKTDVVDSETCETWMRDPDAFAEALQEDPTYMANLSRSLALVLGEFYEQIKAVGVSAATGDGVDELFDALLEKADEFNRDYKPMVEQRAREKQERDLKRMRKDMEKMEVGKGKGKAKRGDDLTGRQHRKPDHLDDEEDIEDEDEEDEVSEDDDEEDDTGEPQPYITSWMSNKNQLPDEDEDVEDDPERRTAF